MLAENNGFGGNTPFTFTGFVPGRNLLFLPLLHLPFLFPAYKQALSLAVLICRDAGVSVFPSVSLSSPLTLPPLSTSNVFLAAAGRSVGQPWSWHDAGHPLHPPRTGRATTTCCADCRIRPSPRAMAGKHPCARYRVDPCSMLKSGHGKDKEKHKPAHANPAVTVLPLQGTAKLQSPLSRCTNNQAGPAPEHSQPEKPKEGG